MGKSANWERAKKGGKLPAFRPFSRLFSLAVLRAVALFFAPFPPNLTPGTDFNDRRACKCCDFASGTSLSKNVMPSSSRQASRYLSKLVVPMEVGSSFSTKTGTKRILRPSTYSSIKTHNPSSSRLFTRRVTTKCITRRPICWKLLFIDKDDNSRFM